MIPCTNSPLNCSAAEWAQIQAYAPAFMDEFLANINPDSHNGAFLDACLVHGSTNSPIDGLTNSMAFQSWLSGNKTHGNWWVEKCDGGSVSDSGSILTGPCDRGSACKPFPRDA